MLDGWHLGAGVPDAHFHDLRHTGGTLTTTTGATIKELTALLGHSSTPAAMIYQHATRDLFSVSCSLAEAAAALRPRPYAAWALASTGIPTEDTRIVTGEVSH